jgi:tetratricopeptide (TPR) repeat protein
MSLRSSILVLALFLVSTSANADEEHSFAANYLAGRVATRLQDTAAASQFLANALQMEPDNSILIERLFLLQLAAGNISQAETSAAKVVGFNSQQRMARITLGLKEFRDQNYAAARSNFNEAAYTPDGELVAALLNAWTYAAEGSLDSAMKELAKNEGQDSFVSAKLINAALIADYMGSGVRAEAQYRKAIELAGPKLRVVQAYGNFLERNKRSAEAIKLYNSYLQSGQIDALIQSALKSAQAGTVPSAFVATPGEGVGEVLYALASTKSGDQDGNIGLLYCQLALAFTGDLPMTVSLLGDLQSILKSYQSAIDAYEQIPVSSPLRVYADLQISLNLFFSDKTDLATIRLNKLLQVDPKNLTAWTVLGDIHRIKRNNQKAIDAYTSGIDLFPPNSGSWQLYFNRGETYDNAKDYAKAEIDFRKALSLAPNEPKILNYLGYSLIEHGKNLDEALAMVKKSVELRPDGYNTDSLGWAYYTMGDFDLAADYLERAVDLKASDPIIAEHLGDAYWHVGRKNEAYFQWQHAKDNGAKNKDLMRVEVKLKNGLVDVPKINAADAKPVLKQ